MNITQLSPLCSAAPQIQPDDLELIAKAGFRTIINNRPDDEQPDQPLSRAIEAEASRLGLAYHHIPIVPGQASEADERAFAAALEASDGPALAFCRTGNRAVALWNATLGKS